ncbi:MAG: exonuclease [Nanohaloarchaea archaeon SW_10_44_10]|nr:MAG: exonuclease [Nanohaloarchaea archaeon SW_10_44_10]
MKLENSFILAPGIGEKTEQKLWKNNVTHWDKISQANVIGSSRRETLEGFLKKARKNLQVGNSYFFGDKLPNKSLWRAYRNFEENACFFDIETTGLDKSRNKVTTIAFHRNGETRTLVRGQNLTRENIQREISNSSMLVTFNGKKFDQPFLEHSFDLDIDTPHLDLMYPCKRIGLSGGLKKIEKRIGIDRDLEDVDGREAVRLWKKYENKNDEDALDKLVEYNGYDARNLQELAEIVHQRLESRFYRPHIKR